MAVSRTRQRRRANGGAAGAPAELLTTELSYNETDDTLYIGYGDDGNGNATSIRAVAGAGAFMRLVTDQLVAGIKTFSASPIVPTPNPGDNTTKAASTAFVTAAIAALSAGGTWGNIDGTITNQPDLVNYVSAQIAAVVNSAPGVLDTLNELAAALGNDANFATSMSNALAAKASLTLSNLSDLTVARANLGLGSMAVQASNAVNITGGTVSGVILDNVVLDGGTF